MLMLYGASPHPFSLEKSVEESLKSMEFPADTRVVSVVKEGHMYSVILEDEEHALFHQVNFQKPLGLFWVPKGGSYGFERKEETLAKAYWGMSTINNKSVYKVYGYSNDARATHIKSNWLEGKNEIMLEENGYFHFIMIVNREQNINFDLEVEFFDQQGQLLYKLDHMNNEKMKDNPVAKVQKESKKDMPIEKGNGNVTIEYDHSGVNTTIHAYKLDPKQLYEIFIGDILFGPEQNVIIRHGNMNSDTLFRPDSNGELLVSMYNPIRVLGKEKELKVTVKKYEESNVLVTIPFRLEK
ncbi:hypothetical protein [Bacillus pinisoli]|uniref:hypothetical protein n=1 Tax=Bacillus pinisoli TaxID=2901866 RepID=UPI001FF24398|nr:hypothetical protein [Bacillus pinisoli]